MEKALNSGEKFPKIYFFTSNKQNTERFAKHIDVKYIQQSEVIELDLTKDINYNILDYVDSDLLFCATGFFRKNKLKMLVCMIMQIPKK